MWSPSLASLSLTAPTGVNNRKKVSPGAGRAEPPPPPDRPRPDADFIDELPFDLYQLVAHNLAALAHGSPLGCCKDLANWCAAAPKLACDEEVWREAYALAFGLVEKPGSTPPAGLFAPLQVAQTWKDAFYAACKSLDALPVAERNRWAHTAEWDQRYIDRRLLYLKDWYMHKAVQTSASALSLSFLSDATQSLRLLLIARGGEEGRWLREKGLSEELIAAARQGVGETPMRALLARGAWPDYVRGLHEALNPTHAPGNQSALAAAARQGHTSVVRMLLDAGVGNALDGVIRPRDGTPLYWAVLKGHAEVAELLIGAGANASGMNMLTVAVSNYRNDADECVRLILEAGGADPNGTLRSGTLTQILAGYDASLAPTPRNIVVVRVADLERQLAVPGANALFLQPALTTARNTVGFIDSWLAAHRPQPS